MAAPIIFDYLQIARQRKRFAASAESSSFLLDQAAHELLDRLKVVERAFTNAAVIGAYHGTLPRLLLSAYPVLNVASQTYPDALARLCPSVSVAAHDDLLPFAPGSLDLAMSAMSLHLVNDLPGTLIQIRRALKPDGLFLAALLGGDTLIELREAFMIAEQDISGGVSPRVFPTANVRDLGGLLQRAGFALPVTDTEQLTVTYPTPLALMEELKAMGAANPLAARSRRFMRRDLLARAIEVYSAKFANLDGRIRATFELIYVSGWSPHESRQKPLRPGSATALSGEAAASA